VRARPQTLYLFHHDPDQSDAVIDAKVAQVQAVLEAKGVGTRAIAPTQLAEFQV